MATSAAVSGAALPAQGRMTDNDFKKFSEFVHKRVGIKLTSAKKSMVETRLNKRMRALGLRSHHDYVSYVFSEEGMEKELSNLIDAVTTNTTHFFRENQHFEYLSGRILPAWLQQQGLYKRMRLWSAGCSIGMEPYTMAMVLGEFASRNTGFEYAILGTDISTQALRDAIRAVYDEERVATVPRAMKEKYLLRSRDRLRRQVRIVPDLRQKVEFRHLNFMEEFTFKEPFDIIFCRNVVIYFDRETQERLFAKFCRFIKPGGHLVIGHSESLTGMSLPLRQVAPTIYQRD